MTYMTITYNATRSTWRLYE